ncbi:hypothetical protein [Streptomyces sp. NPDC093223]|uniref:hypothetical protein n=1 Tax=Streptomyces sp. NPDC093223 TaxID=3366033 RepID=UPI0038222ED1
MGTPARGCLSAKTALDTRAGAEAIRAGLRDLLDGLERVLAERLSQDGTADLPAVPPAEAARLRVTLTLATSSSRACTRIRPGCGPRHSPWSI